MLDQLGLRHHLARPPYQVLQQRELPGRQLDVRLAAADRPGRRVEPQVTGYQVCERLRAERNWVPVLILSAKDGEYDQADGLDLGADDYMTKPFSYVVLAARLRALLRRGARPRPAVLVAGDLRLDPAARTVRRGEAGVELTAREFALLEYLMRRAGQVVSKAELIEHVWDSDAVADLNVVEVYAGYVRRKIDTPFGRSALQTVRGAGYRLAADGG
ncbi:MAG TPA: response regulator transcription factor [Streptosporangiaceae bacterium]